MAIAHWPLAQHFDLLAHVSHARLDGLASDVVARYSDDRVKSGTLGDESTVLVDLGRGAGRDDAGFRPRIGRELNRIIRNGFAVYIESFRFEEDDVTRANVVAARDQLERGDRVRRDVDVDVAAHGFRVRRDPHHARFLEGERAKLIEARNALVAGLEPYFDVGAIGTRRVGHSGLDRCHGSGIKSRWKRDEIDGGRGWVGDGDGNLDRQQCVGAPMEILGILWEHRDEHMLAGPVSLDVPGGIDAYGTPASRKENDGALDNIAVFVEHRGHERGFLADLQV